MKLIVENNKLASVIGVLDKLELVGLQSLHRTRLNNQLIEKLKQIVEEEKNLKESYAKKDDDGEAIIVDGKYQFDEKSKEKLAQDLKVFYKEKVVIDSEDNPIYLKSVKNALEESQLAWQGQQAYDYAYLYEAFEGGEQE